MRLFSLLLLVLVTACMPSEPDTATLGPATRVAAITNLNVLREPRPAGPALQADRILARDGAVLPLKTWLPATTLHAVVLALHGFNDYSNAFSSVGPAFAADGVALFAYDQRGFGAAPLHGGWAGSRKMIDDALAAVQLLHGRYPDVPLYLMGESMGGAVAILAANRAGHGPDAPQGVILVAPAVWGRSAMNVFERAGLWLADLAPNVRWSPDLIPVRILASDNIPMLRQLGHDPLVIKDTRAATLNGLVDLMSEALAEAPRYSARTLILYGAQDQIVPRRAVERFVADLPARAAQRQRVAYYPAGYHMMLRDLEGSRVIADVLAWIDTPDAPLPSGADRDARARLAGRAVPTPTALTRPGGGATAAATPG
jgi:alpha-beta hydrolase superfamily lysophospholipase